jgi:glycosyltransferase involved in cell wall biosynthesis
MAGAASVATMLTDVVLPCLNEAAALPWVLSRMPPGYRPIVADNGSDDGSAEIAERYGALVVTVPLRGFGAACHGGLMAATSDVVCFMDADGSLDPGDLPLVAGPVLTGAADLVLGRRRPEGSRAWPLHARMGNRVIAAAVRRRTGIRLRDLGPMRAAGRADLVRLGLRDRRFGYPLEWSSGLLSPAGGSASATFRIASERAGQRSQVRSAVACGPPATCAGSWWQ